MTAYTAIPDSDIDPESPGTSSLFTLLRDNPIAITEKASGAPVLANNYVTQAMINSSAVGQGELKTTTSEVSINATTTSETVTSIAGNSSYGFMGQVKYSAAVTRVQAGQLVGVDKSYTTTTSYRLLVYLSAQTNGFQYMRVRYVQASPPYDLGDGEIPLFIFALMDNASGKISALNIAEDAPWHYDLPMSKYTEGGKSFAMVTRAEEIKFKGGDLRGSFLNPAKREEYKEILLDKTLRPMEITQEIKNKNMDKEPHPFTANDNAGKTIVMLDPVSDITHELAALKKAGESVNDILHDDYFIIDNSHIGRAGPTGLMIPSFRWKNTV